LKRRTIIIPTAIILAIIVAALLVYLLPPLYHTRLTFELEDSVSHGWVWDATVRLENREMTTFYQSDRGPVELAFTGLTPGRRTLTITAPNYESVTIPITLHLGANRIAKPIEMVGYQIPDLGHFTMFESTSSSAITVQVRPVSTAGPAVTNHPCLDLWIGALVSVELANGKPAAQPVESGGVRGPTLYKGRIPWSWDSSPSATFRYSATIPFSDFSSSSAPYLVIDYLVIVPDPRKISSKEIDAMMKDAPDFTNTAQLKSYLDSKSSGDRFRYFFSTSWNVKGPAST